MRGRDTAAKAAWRSIARLTSPRVAERRQRRSRRQRGFAGRPRPQQPHRAVLRPAPHRRGWRAGPRQGHGRPRRRRPHRESALRHSRLAACRWRRKSLSRPEDHTLPAKRGKERGEGSSHPAFATSKGKRPLLRRAGNEFALEIDLSKEDTGATPDVHAKGERVADLTQHGQQFVLCKAAAADWATGTLRQLRARRRVSRSRESRVRKAIFFSSCASWPKSAGRLSERGQVHAAHGHFQGAPESCAVSVHHAAPADRHRGVCRLASAHGLRRAWFD